MNHGLIDRFVQVMILSQLVASLLFETYIFLTFNSLKSPALARKTYIYVW